MNQLTHVGMIMDGNRRWAKNHGMLPLQGHDKGADVFENVCIWCINKGIPYLTTYAFSTENWKRDQKEVHHIFALLSSFFSKKLQTCYENGIKMKVIGEREHFDKATLSIIEKVEAQQPLEIKLHVQIALSYGGRDEIIRAIKSVCHDVSNQFINVPDITEDYFSSKLDTSGVPDVDLVIRTGGGYNRRLSNFLTWQTVYSELYFSDLLWPDFDEEEFDKAIEYYNSVQRNLGK